MIQICFKKSVTVENGVHVIVNRKLKYCRESDVYVRVMGLHFTAVLLGKKIDTISLKANLILVFKYTLI